MAINKVSYGNETLIDLTSDTLTSASQLLDGVSAHSANGEVVTGTLKKHNLIAATIDKLDDTTLAIQNGSFRLGWYPDLCGDNLTSMTSFSKGVVQSDSMIGIVGNASLLGNATSDDIVDGKTALTSDGLVTGTYVLPTYVTIRTGTSIPSNGLGNDGDLYLKL